jgi:hypothetical protein
MKNIVEAAYWILCLFFGKFRQPKWFRIPVGRRAMIAMVKDGKQ